MGKVNPKKRAKRTGEGMFFKERTYDHELLKIGAFTLLLTFLFCFLRSLFFISSDRFIALPDHKTRFSSPNHSKNLSLVLILIV